MKISEAAQQPDKKTRCVCLFTSDRYFLTCSEWGNLTLHSHISLKTKHLIAHHISKHPEGRLLLPQKSLTILGATFTCLYVSLSFYMLFFQSKGCESMSLNPTHVSGSVKQEQRVCQNSRWRMWGSNNRDWQRQTEKQHHKHMLTNQKDGDELRHQTACCTALISLRL